MRGDGKGPDVWTDVPLKSLVESRETRNPRKEGNGTFRYVDIDALDNRSQRITSAKELQNSHAPSRARLSLKAGDVVFSLVRPYLKNLAIVPEELDGAVGSTAYCVLRPRPDVDSRFLFYQLLQDKFINSVPTYGSSPPAARDDEFLATQVRLTSLEQQRRIVQKIDQLFSDIDAGIAALEGTKANLVRYRAAVLKAAVEGKLVETGDAEWAEANWIRLDAIVADLDQGWSPRCDRKPAAVNEWGVIKTTAVQAMTYWDDENKRLPQKLAPRRDLELAVGDILITRAGPRSRCGVACMVRRTRPRLMVCDKVYRLRCRTDVVRAPYLELVLNAPQIQWGIEKLKTGISDSGVNLTQGRLRNLTIPVPSLATQDAVVEKFEELDSNSVMFVSSLDELAKRGARLKQAVLYSAFSGRLCAHE